MDVLWVRVFGYIVAEQARVQAVVAEIAGMRADNSIALLNETPQPFDREHFNAKADELRHHAFELDRLARSL